MLRQSNFKSASVMVIHYAITPLPLARNQRAQKKTGTRSIYWPSLLICWVHVAAPLRLARAKVWIHRLLRCLTCLVCAWNHKVLCPVCRARATFLFWNGCNKCAQSPRTPHATAHLSPRSLRKYCIPNLKLRQRRTRILPVKTDLKNVNFAPDITVVRL